MKWVKLTRQTPNSKALSPKLFSSKTSFECQSANVSWIVPSACSPNTPQHPRTEPLLATTDKASGVPSDVNSIHRKKLPKDLVLIKEGSVQTPPHQNLHQLPKIPSSSSGKATQ